MNLKQKWEQRPTCPQCGHKIDVRCYDKREEITRYVFEGICKFCQRTIEDPNPERTKRCSQ